MKKVVKTIAAEFRILKRIGSALLGKPVVVKPVPAGSNDIGYTNISGVPYIFIAENNPFYDGLTPLQKVIMRKGVFAHEILHQLLTNFNHTTKVLSRISSENEKNMLMQYINILEDPGIEHFAPTQFSGSLLSSLYFTIAWIYKKSPSIEESESPLAQYLNALIQFGDMGIIKGEFTFPDAEKAFRETIDEFYEGLTNPDGKARVDAAVNIFKETKYLWEETVRSQDAFDEFMKELIKKSGKTFGGKGKGSTPSSDASEGEEGDTENEEKREKNRKKTLASFGKGSSGKSEKSDGKNADKEAADFGEDTGERSSAVPTEETSALDTDEIAKSIAKEIKSELESEAAKMAEEEKNEVNDFVPDGGSGISNIGKLLNVVYTNDSVDEELYNSTVLRLRASIRRTANALKRLLAEDRAVTRPWRSGQIKASNIYINGDYTARMGRITPNIFDKRFDPDDKKDMAVAVAVDLSGSMSGGMGYSSSSRVEVARDCAVILAEVFAELKIPIYIMGFDADRNGYDTVHHHFIRWKNTLAERKTLTKCVAHSNNRDGASIRYLTRTLDKKAAKNKLLIVISDGQPAAHGYYGDSGNRDTAKAVAEAKAKFPVLGVAIGADIGVLKSFYGNDFLVATKGEDLLNGIVGKLKDLLKSEAK